jgi:hypothetical protein
MPLKQLTATTLTQECPFCGTDNDIDVSSLEAGQENGLADCIGLPPCESCGALEVLIRNKSGAGHREHSLAVNRLHARLKAAEQTCTGFPGGDEDAADMAADDATITVAL